MLYSVFHNGSRWHFPTKIEMCSFVAKQLTMACGSFSNWEFASGCNFWLGSGTIHRHDSNVNAKEAGDCIRQLRNRNDIMCCGSQDIRHGYRKWYKYIF